MVEPPEPPGRGHGAPGEGTLSPRGGDTEPPGEGTRSPGERTRSPRERGRGAPGRGRGAPGGGDAEPRGGEAQLRGSTAYQAALLVLSSDSTWSSGLIRVKVDQLDESDFGCGPCHHNHSNTMSVLRGLLDELNPIQIGFHSSLCGKRSFERVLYSAETHILF